MKITPIELFDLIEDLCNEYGKENVFKTLKDIMIILDEREEEPDYSFVWNCK